MECLFAVTHLLCHGIIVHLCVMFYVCYASLCLNFVDLTKGLLELYIFSKYIMLS